MSFLYPQWFLALVLIPIILVSVIIIRSNRAKVWAAFVSHHQSTLVRKNKPITFWLSLSFSLIGLICLIVACSRPYIGNTVSREKIQSRNILIAMDTSLSMLCEDIQPNRLSSGITFAVNLINALPDDHFGIMAFAGSPNVITSMSIDHPSIIEELSQLSQDSAHIPGSNLPAALVEGIDTLKRAGKQANALILITDGTDTLEEIDEITKLARDSYVQIFTIGVGTAAGATIPINGKPHLDIEGNAVITKLEDNVLRQLARDSMGVYTNINTQPEAAISEAILSMNQFEQKGREVQIPNELYQWFLAPGILLLILSSLITKQFKRSSAALVVVGFLSTSQHNNAAEPSWMKDVSTDYLDRPAQVKAGYTALAKKEYKSAIGYLSEAREGTTGDERARLSLAIAEAAYRLDDYSLARQEYSQSLTATDPQIQNISQYNLANTLLKQQTSSIKVPEGQDLQSYLEDQIRSGNLEESALEDMQKGLENARAHYSDLLKVKSDHSAAASNKSTTENVIKTIQQARKTIAEEREQKKKEQEKKEMEKMDSQKNKDSAENPDDKNKGDQKGEKEDNKDKLTDEKGKEQEKPQDKDSSKKPDDKNKGDQKGEKEDNKDKPGDEKGKEQEKPQDKDSSKKPDDKNKGDQNGEKEDNKDKAGDEKGKEEDKDKMNGEAKNDNSKEKPENSNENPKPGESTDSSKDEEARQPNDPNEPSNTEKPAEFSDQEKALKFLKDHADTRKKPLSNRRAYYHRPAVDW